jgi:hypothetical protein
MLDRVLEISGQGAFVPILLLIGVGWMIPGIFAFARSRSSNRRDFLELWKGNPAPDDLWLETMVRHLFGEWLPADVIRSLLSSPQAGRALLEVSAAWSLLAYDDETRIVTWRNWSCATHLRRRFLACAYLAGYLVALPLAFLTAKYFVKLQLAGVEVIFWVYPIGLAMLAVFLAIASVTLSEADKSVPRWLGLK